MHIEGLPLAPVMELAAKHGLIATYIPAEDESVDEQISFFKGGTDTGIAVQIAGRFYCATEFDGKSLWLGCERTSLTAAAMDALARYSSKAVA